VIDPLREYTVRYTLRERKFQRANWPGSKKARYHEVMELGLAFLSWSQLWREISLLVHVSAVMSVDCM